MEGGHDMTKFEEAGKSVHRYETLGYIPMTHYDVTDCFGEHDLLVPFMCYNSPPTSLRRRLREHVHVFTARFEFVAIILDVLTLYMPISFLLIY
jgi:hypothetical protein